MSEQPDTPASNPLAFSEWSASNVFDDPLESRLRYGNYLREEYINEGVYDAKTEGEIRAGFSKSLVKGGLLNEDGSNQEELEERINTLQRKDVADDTQLQDQVNVGELPMARLSTGQLLVGDAAANTDIVSAIKASSFGGVNMSDALAAQAQLDTPDGFDMPLYKIQRVANATRLLQTERKNNTAFDIQIDGLSTEAAQDEHSTLDWLEHSADAAGRGVVNFFARVLGKGDQVDEEEERRDAIKEAQGADVSQLATQYAMKLDLAPEDTQMALEQMILENGVNKGMFELHDLDDKDVGKNLRMGGYGLPVMSAQAMVNKDLFDATLAAHSELSEEVKTMLNKQRTQVLRGEFTTLDKFLSGSNVSDSWNTALVAGRSAGLADYKILESFVADEDNYNEFKERAAGIGMSFVNGVGQLFAAIPAAMGFEGAKDYLADVAQKNADRRQLAEVFGQEFGLFQDLGETAFPMLVDMGATVLLSVATAPAGGVGGVAYLGAKSAGTVGARLTAKGIVKGLTSRTLMRTTAKGAADQADDLIKDGIIKGSKEGAIDIIKAYNGKVAQRLRNVPAVFVPAATRSGSATYGAVYNQLQQNPDVSADEAHDRALGAALMAGTFTGMLTGAFSAIGKGGLEDALLKGLSTKQMNRVAQSITDRFEGDMLSSARKAISKAMKDAGMVSTIKGLKVPVLSEGAEEGIDEFVNSLITDASLDEDTPMIDRIMQGFHAALLGGIMGGSVPLVQRGFRRLRPEAAVMQEKASFFDDILENMTANLNESGSPITAEVIDAILTDPTRKDTRMADVPTEEEQQQILEEDEQDVAEEGESLGSGINPDPEMEALLDEKITPDNVKKAVASVLAEDVPTIEGADTTTVEAKGAMMEQLNLPLQETSAAENSDHLAVRGLIGGRRVTREGSQFAKRLQNARPAEETTTIDPARKEEAEQIEATFREEAAKIDEAAALYNKLERQVQGAEDASGVASPVRRGLQQRVSEGKALSPEKATELKGEAFKKRVLALKGLKIKTKVKLEEVTESKEETQSIENIASHGFPHVLNAAKLKKLGVPVNERTVSNTFLNTASNRIESEINNRFPRIKQSKPSGGFAIDSLYGKGKVYMDRFGVGKFDNDPLNMLTLLEMGNPVVVTPDQLNSSTINPAFRFTRLGDQVVISDIVAPQSGGLVSVLTPATRAVNIQPDYTRLVNLIDRVSALRKEGLTNPDELVPSPFEEEAQISKADLLQRLETSASVAEFFPRARLTNNFAESALIELRLRAQESLFTGKRVELVSLGQEVQELYVGEQSARLRGVNESYLSTVEVSQTSALSEDNEFRADAEAQDNYTPFPENAPAPFAESQIKNVLRQTQADAVAAVDGDVAIRNSLINLLRNEAFEGASPNFDKMSGKKLFDFTLQWMAQGNNRSNRSSLEFQRALRGNNFELAAPIREALQVMGLSPVSLEGTPDTNPAYKELLRAKLSDMKGGAVPSDNEISSFYNYVRRSVGTLLLRSQPFSGGIGMLDMLNGSAVEALGLKSGDSSSIVEALERIVGVSDRAQKEYDSHLVAIARLLLRSPDFLNSIELSIVKSKLPFAGTFDVLTDGTPAITINLRGHNPRGVADTLVHELIHAYVTGITRKAPAELTVQEANALKGLENVIGAVKKEFISRSKAGMSSAILSGPSFKEAEGGYKFYDSRVSDALRNVDEFVAHFLTSTDFQKFVKSVLANSTLETQAINQNQTLFERIITAIRTLFKDSSVKFDAAFSSVLDLSHAAVLTKQGARRKNKDLISLSDFKALSDVSSKGAKDFIADKVFSDTPATNDTARREPVTADAIVGKISEDVSREQHEADRLSSGLNETTSEQTELDRIGKKNVSRVVSFIQNFIIPPEMRVELDPNHKGLADVDNNTGVMRINPVRLTKLLGGLKNRNGGNPVSMRTQINMLAVVLNEEVAHAASVAVITREDQDAIINEMTLAQAEEAVKNYGDEGNESERVRLIEGWKRGDRGAQVTVMEEYLRMYSQKVTRGFTTEEEVSFLRQNPSAISVVKRHFKRYVNKLGFYRSRKNISPQLRTAVGRVVNEVRAMESGFRLGSNFRAFDPNDPESVINLFRKQAEMNKPVGSPEEEERSMPVAASGISADIPADATTVLDGDEWENVGPQLGSNKGGQYVDPATGVKYYYKESQTPDHARNEVLATVLYETAGAKVVPVRLTNREGELGTSSVFREDLKEFDPKNETMRKAAFPDFAVHALLANWDVVGLVYDNLMVDPDGNVVHLDTGGALKFRAQGEPKGDAWNGGGSEFSTLRVMGQAGEVFKGMTEQDLQDSARKLLSLSNETITEVVQQVLGTDNDSQEMINTLIERRDNILTAAFTDKEFYLESKALGSGITDNESTFVSKVKEGDFTAAQKLIDGGVKMNRALFLGVDIRAGKTQNVGTTIHQALTKKEVINKEDYKDGGGLVYGAGTGGAASALDADSFEPFPPSNFTPTYTGDRAGGRGDTIKKYQHILNTFVLNVVEPQTRDFILKDIANLLEVGGTAVIVTRGGDVAGRTAPLLKFGELEVVRKSKGELTYQKGFRKGELKSYAEKTLGDGFTVTTPTGADIQNKKRVTVIITKDENVTLDNPPLTGGAALGSGITEQSTDDQIAKMIPELLPAGVLGPIRMRSSKRAMLREKKPVARKNLSAEERAELKELGEQYAKIIDDNAEEIIKIQNTLTITPDIADTVKQFQYVDMESEDEGVESYLEYVKNDSPSKLKDIPQFGADRPRSTGPVGPVYGLMAPEIPTAIRKQLQPLVDRAAEIAGYNVDASHISRDIVTGKVVRYIHGTSVADEMGVAQFDTFDSTKSEYAGTEQGKKGLTFFGNTKNISLVQRFIDMQMQGYGESYIPIALKDDAKIFDPRVNFNEFKDTIELAMAYREAGFERREHEDNPYAEKQVLLRWREDPQYKSTMARARYGHWQEMEHPDVVEAIMEKYDAMLLTDSVDADYYRDYNTGKIADEYMNLALQDSNLVKSTAPVTFGPDNQIIPLEERFNPNSDKFLESGITFGDSSDLPSDFNGDGVDYSDFVGVLEMPIAEKGGFKNVKNGFMKLFVGETDPTVQRYVRQRDAFVRTSDDMVEEYYSKYKGAVEKDFKDPDEIPWDVIQTATGTTDNIDPDPDNTLLKDRNTKRDAAMVVYQNDLSSEYQRFAQEEEAEKINIRKTEPSNAKRAELLKQAAIDRRKKEEQAKETLGATKQAAYEKAQDEYKEAKDKAFDIKKAEFIRERNEAFATLKDIAPNLFPVILDLRRLTDELSKSAKNLFGAFSSKDLSVKFDNNMGLYVTRRYQMFSDPDYKERILTSEDERSRAVRDAAIDFMREQYIEFEFQNQKKQGRSDSDAKAFARAEYDRQDSDGVPLGFKMISEFLNSYDTESGTVDFASAFDFAGKPATKQATMGGALKALTKNLEGRSEIPKPLADLMGANNIPEDSLDSLLYTFGTVAKIAAHQNFLVKMRTQGEQNGWLISAKQHAEDVKNANTEKQIVEVGQRRLIQPTGSDSGLNPLAGLYVDKDIYESIKPMFQQTVRQPNDAASKVLQGSLRFMQKATGNAMAAKTLGSIGFYMRNALGNVMFFGPAQGYFGAPKDLFLGSSKRGTGMSAMEGVVRSFKGRKAEANGYLRSLEALGVFGDEVRSEIMMKLMTGEETFNSLDEQLESLAKKSENLVGKPLRAAQQTAARLASAMDSFYKIGYFENELATVKKAAKAEKDNPKLARKFSAMTELQQKEYAADIISATAQSYARALPVIKKLSGSSAGLLIAPFVRFTSEVPRITVNTVRQFSKEIADSNPVIRARGYKRAVGFTSVMAVSTAVPVLLGKFLSGLGEDEDEAYRMSLPPYLRNHTFYYFTEKAGKAYDFAKMISGGKDGDVVTLDLTYLNPFSVVADPILRGMEHALRGEPLQATTKFLYTALFEPYLGDQILAGSVIDIKENRDARTGRPIVEESDPAHVKTGKMLVYLGREAYGPRTVLKAIDAYQAAGGKVTKFADSPFGIIMSEFLPVRPRANDPSDQFSRVAFRLRDEQRRVQQRFGELKRGKGMSEGSVRGVYEDVLKSRLRINNRMTQAMRGFQGLGVTNYKIYQGLQSANYGDRRSKLLFSGFMENPVPTKNLVDFLMRSPQGQQRLGWLMQAQSENPRFIKLED